MLSENNTPTYVELKTLKISDNNLLKSNVEK